MSAPVFYLPEGLGAAEAGHEVAPGPEVTHHAVRVQRMRVGEEIDLSDGNGLRVSGTVSSVEPFLVRVGAVSREEAARPAIVLAQALAKGDRDLQAVEAATEIGVDAVVPFTAARSIAKWPAAKAEKLRARWSSTLVAAARQSRRAIIPALNDPTDAAGLVRRSAEEGSRLLVLHESAQTPLVSLDLAGAGTPIVLVVGPEGGLTPEELTTFSAAGASVVRLGPTVLRSSSAGPAAATVLATRLGRWG